MEEAELVLLFRRCEEPIIVVLGLNVEKCQLVSFLGSSAPAYTSHIYN